MGNALGAQVPDDAKRMSRVGVAVVSGYALCNGIVFSLLLKNVWARLFTDDAQVLALVDSTFYIMFFYGIAMFWLALFHTFAFSSNSIPAGVFDALKCVTMSILRGYFSFSLCVHVCTWN